MELGCGKVILFGEHAVVYGQPALAAALGRGIEARLIEGSLGAAPWFEVPSWKTTARVGDGTRLGQALEAIIAVLVRRLGEAPRVGVWLESQLPAGAGLGSSAAMAVALARALASSLGPNAAAADDVILEAAEASERVFHGNPSGIDHTTSTLGGIIRFERGARPPFQQLVNVKPLPVIIAQMEAGADTGEMVAGVRRRLDREPERVTQLLQQMGDLTREAEGAVCAGALQHVGRLMDRAHGALSALGVSSGGLDRGCCLAREAGAYGAKLTGAGGGGCLIAVGPPSRTEAIITSLTRAGAVTVFATSAGVRSARPANSIESES